MVSENKATWDSAKNRTPAKHHHTKRTVREEAEFLAQEIQEDVMAEALEIADAIEASIRRYAKIPFCYKGG